ncbi:MAG: phage tail tape measure protein [Anaerolineae bacterium]|nr:phage tail tape measure protein [Anaerolineae bacterium]
MGRHYNKPGRIATQYGLSLEQTSGIMAIFAQRGVHGSEAATQLRSIMRNMTTPTANTTRAWEMLGTTLFNADGSMRNLDDVLGDIRSGMANLNDEQRAFVTQNLAGSYGQVGFNALLASDGIEAMVETMEGQTSASEVAEARMSNVSGGD